MPMPKQKNKPFADIIDRGPESLVLIRFAFLITPTYNKSIVGHNVNDRCGMFRFHRSIQIHERVKYRHHLGDDIRAKRKPAKKLLAGFLFSGIEYRTESGCFIPCRRTAITSNDVVPTVKIHVGSNGRSRTQGINRAGVIRQQENLLLVRCRGLLHLRCFQ